MFRAGLRTLLAATPGLLLAAEAESGEKAVELTLELRPDIVLMDIQMPGVNGIEATRRILEIVPVVGILVLTMFDDDPSVLAAMRAGARGYLLKGASHEEVVRSIWAVARGEAIFGPSVASRLIEFFSSMSAADLHGAFPELSERERQILDLVARGLRNVEIARRLYLSEKTVRNYISSIFSKIQVANRAQAIVKAREAGLGRSDS